MRPRIIIIEGPDNCGKTTLAKKMAKHFNASYWHMTSGPGLQEKPAMRRYQLSAFDNAVHNLQNGLTTIFDRHFISDYVYGTILRDGPAIEPEEMIAKCDEHDVLFIFCDRPTEIATKEHAANKDPDHPYADDEYEKLHKLYRKAFADMTETCGSDRVLLYMFDLMGSDGQTKAFFEGLNKL